MLCSDNDAPATTEQAARELPDTCRVVFQPNGRQGELPYGANLLEAARRLGVEIESICGGHQTCGKCKVIVEEGQFAKLGIVSSAAHLSPPGERERQYAERRGFEAAARLSCACSVTGDVVIRVPEESQTRKQVVRKAAGIERSLTVDPILRLYYVELPPAHLKDHRGDWERLADELYQVHGLQNLRMDWAALRELQTALAASGRCVTCTIWNDQEVVRVQADFHDQLFGVAMDVGTTTVAAHLCHLRTGELLASASRMNPQVPYGEDLMSRVSYAMLHEDGTQRMHQAIIATTNEIIGELCSRAGILVHDVVELVVVGNTTMHHIFLNINPREIGGSPFSLATHGALNVKARDLGLDIAPGANVYVPPCEAGHVGADNVGVLIAEAPYAQESQMLVIDIGTNGEILLGNRRQLLSASSPTGPAFEGAQILHGMRAADGAIERVRIDPATLDVQYRIIGREEWIASPAQPADSPHAAPEGKAEPAALTPSDRRQRRESILNPQLLASGICGSGIIEAVAELFLAGLIGANGRFVTIQHPRLRTGLGNGGGKAEFVLAWPHETSTGQEIVIHADDVRAIQLAKAALYAGAKLLMQRLQLDKVDRIALAGGFGSYVDPRHAMVLGLIPDCDLSRVQAVGNAAGDGARIMLLDKGKRGEADWAARWTTYIETAAEPEFQDQFVAAIEIPHSVDPYPHLQPILDEARGQWTQERVAAIAALANASRNRRLRANADQTTGVASG